MSSSWTRTESYLSLWSHALWSPALILLLAVTKKFHCFSFIFPSVYSQLRAWLYLGSWKKRIWTGHSALVILLLLSVEVGRKRRKRPCWWHCAWGTCSLWDLAQDPEGGHQQLVFHMLDLTKQCSPDLTSCSQGLSFHLFIGVLMKKKHPIDCNS